jgi:hypothetical protein
MSTNGNEVLVTLLGQGDTVSFAARFDELSTRTMQLCTPCPLEWGCLLKLQQGETIWIGEVCYSRHDDLNCKEYRTWVKLVETQYGDEPKPRCFTATA